MAAFFALAFLLIPLLACALLGGLAHAETPEATPDPRPLVVAVLRDYPPWYGLGPEQRPQGLAVELWEEAASRAGLSYTYLVVDRLDQAEDSLLLGRADLVPSLGLTPERQAKFAFTHPVEVMENLVFVRRGSNSSGGLENLRGQDVGAVLGTSSHRMLREYPEITLSEYLDFSSAIFDLLAGGIDVLVGPRPVICRLARRAGVESRLKAVGPSLGEVKRAMALRRGDERLLARIDQALDQVLASPTYQTIYTKWYGRPDPFWTVERVVWAAGLLLLAGLMATGLWRYALLAGHNRRLAEVVAQRQRAEEALRQAQAGLEQRVRERTLALGQANQALAQEVAERKQAEANLRQGDERFRAIMAAAQDFIFLKDRDLRYTHVNQAMPQRLELPVERVLGARAEEIFGPEVAQAMEQTDRLVLAGQVRETEETLPVADRECVFHVVRVPLRDRAGRIEGLCGIARDITARRATEREIRESKATLDAILAASPVGICLLVAGRIQWMNRAMCQMTGYRADQLRGSTGRQLYAQEEEYRRVGGEAKRLLPDLGQMAADTTWVRADGRRIEVFFQLQLRDPGRPDRGLIATVVDITQRKRAEERLVAYQEQLRLLVGELTLAEERERRRLAEDLHDGMGQELALLRISLKSVLGAPGHPSKTRLREMLALVDRAFLQARSLTTELGTPILQDLGLGAALDWLARQASQSHGIQVKYRGPQEVPGLEEDARVLLFRAARELVVNAVKHSGAGHIIITLETVPGHLRLGVGDDGQGLDTARLESYMTKGFGLFSVSERVKFLGGWLAVDSPPGRGTKVTLSVPLATAWTAERARSA